jgi:hypothetical protein
MGTDSVAKKAAKDITRRAKEIGKAMDNVWKVASKAPMFSRVHEKVVTDGKTKKKRKTIVKRSVRMIGSHAYGLAAAGAAQAIAREQQLDCKNLGIGFSRLNLKGAPVAQAQLTPAFKYLVEQFMCAYVQEQVYAARNTLAALPPRKRLNRDLMKLSCNETNEQIFYASGLAPRQVYVVPLPKKKSAKAAEGEEVAEFQPASAEEQAAEEEADLAAAAQAVEDEENQ